ncbi:MAG TPA: transposase [Candidatus Nanoarchaeia archaeon]|nr:transposase [Candidatus Nanoarchaeia archaeon]
MPSPNIVKSFKEDGIYHICHRGIDNRAIMADEEDFEVFLDILKSYCGSEAATKQRRKQLASVELLAYCLLPDHFHILIRQTSLTGMTELMRALGNAYIRYYNRKYDRSGPLFAGKYRAALVEQDEQLIHLTRFIHRHPRVKPPFEQADYPYSSYAYYLRSVVPLWINPAPAWERFYDVADYRDFVEGADVDSEQILGPLVLDRKPTGVV